MINKETMRRMSELRIGQEVTLISIDSGISDAKMTILGLSVSAAGLENICLGEKDGMWQTDSYLLEDIRV